MAHRQPFTMILSSRKPVRRNVLSAGFKARAIFTVLLAASVVAAAIAIWEARIILLVLFAGCLGALILATLTSLLHKWVRIPRTLAFASVLVTLASALALGMWLRGPALARQLSELQDDIPGAVGSVFASLHKYSWGQWILAQATDATQSTRWLAYAASGIGGAMSTTVSTVACLLLVLLASVYLAAEPEFYMRGIRRLLPAKHLPDFEAILSDAIRTLRFWLLARLVTMTTIGILVSAGLWLLGVPLAGTLGLMAALLTFIPNLGPFVSAVPAALLAFTVSPVKGLLTVVLFCLAHFIEGNFVTPLAERRIVKLPPFLTLSLQLILAPATGALGVALAAPLLAVIMSVVRVYRTNSRDNGKSNLCDTTVPNTVQTGAKPTVDIRMPVIPLHPSGT
jgi:predicted PurR-regulated permease PerM